CHASKVGPTSTVLIPAESDAVRSLAGRSVVAMELAGRRDGQTDRRAITGRPDVVVVPGGREDDVAGAGVDDLRAAFDLPVDLAFEHNPPLVRQMIVAIGVVARWLADERAGHLLVDDDLLHPGGGALTALDVLHSRVPRLASKQSHRHCRRHAIPSPFGSVLYTAPRFLPARDGGRGSHHGGLTPAAHPDITCAPRRGGASWTRSCSSCSTASPSAASTASWRLALGSSTRRPSS